MSKKFGITVALSTHNSVPKAKRLAKELIDSKVAACVTILPNAFSMYLWKGKLMSERELVLLIKTTAAKRRQLLRVIQTKHPYDTPEILCFEAQMGSSKYRRWVTQSIGY